MAQTDDVARDNNYAGAAFQADAAIASQETPVDDENLNDDTSKPSEQTDYRSVDNGLTSVGATTQNADTAVLGATDTPGVRTGSDVDEPGVKVSGRTHQSADERKGTNRDDKVSGDVINDPYNR